MTSGHSPHLVLGEAGPCPLWLLSIDGMSSTPTRTRVLSTRSELKMPSGWGLRMARSPCIRSRWSARTAPCQSICSKHHLRWPAYPSSPPSVALPQAHPSLSLSDPPLVSPVPLPQSERTLTHVSPCSAPLCPTRMESPVMAQARRAVLGLESDQNPVFFLRPLSWPISPPPNSLSVPRLKERCEIYYPTCSSPPDACGVPILSASERFFQNLKASA